MKYLGLFLVLIADYYRICYMRKTASVARRILSEGPSFYVSHYLHICVKYILPCILL